MKVKISFLKNNLSAILAKLGASTEVLVMDRNTPVAVLRAFAPGQGLGKDDEILASLERQGILRRGAKKLDLKHFPKPVKLNKDLDAVGMLIQDRESGW